MEGRTEFLLEYNMQCRNATASLMIRMAQIYEAVWLKEGGLMLVRTWHERPSEMVALQLEGVEVEQVTVAVGDGPLQIVLLQPDLLDAEWQVR